MIDQIFPVICAAILILAPGFVLGWMARAWWDQKWPDPEDRFKDEGP